MAYVTVRNMDEVALNKITQKAKKINISREEYIRRLLLSDAMKEEVAVVERKYENLVLVVKDILLENIDAITKVENRLIDIEAQLRQR